MKAPTGRSSVGQELGTYDVINGKDSMELTIKRDSSFKCHYYKHFGCKQRMAFFMHPPLFLSPDLPNLKAMVRDKILYFDF